MIVLPLILGIGIDDGVHLIHDYRSRRDCRYRMTGSTVTSILITSLTTMIGFGSMMIASHRGLQSLGRVLVIGVTCCLATSITVLPILLSLWTRGKKDAWEESEEPEQYEEPEIVYAGEEVPEVYIYEEYVPQPSVKPKRLVRRSGGS
jgi:predicted RND superfamily exporter protein